MGINKLLTIHRFPSSHLSSSAREEFGLIPVTSQTLKKSLIAFSQMKDGEFTEHDHELFKKDLAEANPLIVLNYARKCLSFSIQPVFYQHFQEAVFKRIDKTAYRHLQFLFSLCGLIFEAKKKFKRLTS